jgi:hypothetical protein
MEIISETFDDLWRESENAYKKTQKDSEVS